MVRYGPAQHAPVVAPTRVEEHGPVGGHLRVRHLGDVERDRNRVRQDNTLQSGPLRAVRQPHQARRALGAQPAQERRVDVRLGLPVEARHQIRHDDRRPLNEHRAPRRDVPRSEHPLSGCPAGRRLDAERASFRRRGAGPRHGRRQQPPHADVQERGGLGVGVVRVGHAEGLVHAAPDMPREVEVRRVEQRVRADVGVHAVAHVQRR
ncbi:unnamed protein product [Mycena citricolor]|uniref:Uncharacterized protein n=1 Tax=Mycena citricolor TaxID=2018698 RepID=A0AAD2Q2S5_9AGAR|nr:unnamed protein product [Mycena citricolor]